MGEAARIGVVLHDFSAGGTERIAICLANRWSRSREVTLFCGDEEGPARALVSSEVKVRRVDPFIRRGHGSRARLGKAIAAMLRTWPVDIMVGPGNFHIPVLRALARQLGDARPAIVCKLSNPLARRGRNRLAQSVFEASLRRATRDFDGLVAMSPTLHDEAVAVLRHERVTTVFEPVDAPGAIRQPAAGPPTILSAGRLVAQKNMALALDAFARFPDRSARLIVAGDGPQRTALEEQATRLGIAGRVAFTGHVPGIAPLLAQAHLFLATSVYEGYPAVLIEAIAAGVPIVTTGSSPAIAEILAHPSFGIQADADPAALADAMRHILDGGKPDADARVQFLARHDPDRAALAWLAVLDDAVRQRFNAARGAARPAICTPPPIR